MNLLWVKGNERTRELRNESGRRAPAESSGQLQFTVGPAPSPRSTAPWIDRPVARPAAPPTRAPRARRRRLIPSGGDERATERLERSSRLVGEAKSGHTPSELPPPHAPCCDAQRAAIDSDRWRAARRRVPRLPDAGQQIQGQICPQLRPTAADLHAAAVFARVLRRARHLERVHVRADADEPRGAPRQARSTQRMGGLF